MTKPCHGILDECVHGAITFQKYCYAHLHEDRQHRADIKFNRHGNQPTTRVVSVFVPPSELLVYYVCLCARTYSKLNAGKLIKQDFN